MTDPQRQRESEIRDLVAHSKSPSVANDDRKLLLDVIDELRVDIGKCFENHLGYAKAAEADIRTQRRALAAVRSVLVELRQLSPQDERPLIAQGIGLIDGVRGV